MAPEDARTLSPTTAKWVDRVRDAIASQLDAHPLLAAWWRHGTVLLYGSTALGVDDAHSDIDLLLLIREEKLFHKGSATNFFDFPLSGKAGHLTVEPVCRWQERLRTCQMPYIYQLRNAVVVCGETSEVAELLRKARQGLPDPVARAFAAHHYVKMREGHRSCDNAMERREAAALLLLIPQVIAHALRAAIVMRGIPYPYDKWLYQEVARLPEGPVFCKSVGRILDLLAQDALRLKVPERANPISHELRAIRRHLVEMAKLRGWDGPWLDKWWLYMHEIENTMGRITWTDQ